MCTTNDPSTTDADFQSIIGKGHPAIGQVALLHSTSVTGGKWKYPRNHSGRCRFSRILSVHDPDFIRGKPNNRPSSPWSRALTRGSSPNNAPSLTTPLDAGSAISIDGPNLRDDVPQDQQPWIDRLLRHLHANPGSRAVYGDRAGRRRCRKLQLDHYFSRSSRLDQPVQPHNHQPGGGVTVMWTGGGGASGFVQISGQSSVPTSTTSSVSARFDCVANVSDGSFTIPAAVLLAPPPTTTTLGTLNW